MGAPDGQRQNGQSRERYRDGGEGGTAGRSQKRFLMHGWPWDAGSYLPHLVRPIDAAVGCNRFQCGLWLL